MRPGASKRNGREALSPASLQAEEDPHVAEEHQHERQAVLEEQQRGHVGEAVLVRRPQLHADQMVPWMRQRWWWWWGWGVGVVGDI